jgi:hypothetical protein
MAEALDGGAADADAAGDACAGLRRSATGTRCVRRAFDGELFRGIFSDVAPGAPASP